MREIAREVAAADWGGDDDLAIVRRVDGRAQFEWPIGRVVYRAPGVGGLFPSTPLPRARRGRHAGGRAGAVLHQGRAHRPLGANESSHPGPGSSRAGLAWSPDAREIWFNGGDHEWAGEVRAVSPAGAERVVARAPGSLRLFDTGSTRRGNARRARDLPRGGLGRLAGDAAPRDLTWSQDTWIAAIAADGRSFLIQHTSSLDGTTYLARGGQEPIRLGDGTADRPVTRWRSGLSS